jgi:hypothetical protein
LKRLVLAVMALGVFALGVACTHDFGAFDVTDDAGADGETLGDAGKSDAGSDGGDAASCEASSICLSQATSCANGCGSQETTCSGQCQNQACRTECKQVQTTCVTNCGSICVSCTTSSGCASSEVCDAAVHP